MNIVDEIEVSKKIWWILGVATLTGIIPVGAVLYKSPPTSWYWSEMSSDARTLIMVLGFLILVFGIIIYLSSRTKVFIRGDRSKIRTRIHPFMSEDRIINLRDIESIDLRRFDAIGSYGGVGYRKTLGKTTAYIMSFAGTALEMKLKNGKILAVEISKEGEWKKYLEYINNLNIA